MPRSRVANSSTAQRLDPQSSALLPTGFQQSSAKLQRGGEHCVRYASPIYAAADSITPGAEPSNLSVQWAQFHRLADSGSFARKAWLTRNLTSLFFLPSSSRLQHSPKDKTHKISLDASTIGDACPTRSPLRETVITLSVCSARGHCPRLPGLRPLN
jgi:hypothetical protein